MAEGVKERSRAEEGIRRRAAAHAVREPAKVNVKAVKRLVREAVEPALPPTRSLKFKASAGEKKKLTLAVPEIAPRKISEDKARKKPAKKTEVAKTVEKLVKPEAKAEVKVVESPVAKVHEAVNELKIEAKAEAKSEDKVESRTELKAESRTELKAEPKTEVKADSKAEAKNEPVADSEVAIEVETSARPIVPIVSANAIVDPALHNLVQLLASSNANGDKQLRFRDVTDAQKALKEIAAGQAPLSAMAQKIVHHPDVVNTESLAKLKEAMVKNPTGLVSAGEVTLPNGETVKTVFHLGLSPAPAPKAEPVSNEEQTIAEQLDLPDVGHLNAGGLLRTPVKTAIENWEKQLKDSGYARIYAVGDEDKKLYVVAAEGVKGVKLEQKLALDDQQHFTVVAYADSNNSWKKAMLSVVHDTVNKFASMFAKVIRREFARGKNITQATIMKAEEQAEAQVTDAVKKTYGKRGLAASFAVGGAVITAIHQGGALIVNQVSQLLTSLHGTASTLAIGGGSSAAALVVHLGVTRVANAIVTKRHQSLREFYKASGLVIVPVPSRK